MRHAVGTAALLLAVALFAAPAGGEEKAAPLPAAPALWRVSDADSALYLFGTYSAVPQGAPWRSRALAAAIDAADVLWFEAPVGEPGAAAAADAVVKTQGRLPAGKSLAALLPPQSRQALEGLADKLRIKIDTLDGLRPWAAFVVLSGQANAGAGLSGGADADLMSEAKGRGRKLQYFEAIESSLRVLTQMPEAEQIALLSFLIDDFARQQSRARPAFEAWRAGDAAALDALLNKAMREAAPSAYKRLVADRSAALAADIAGVLQRRETAFVALDAGYLVGPDGLPDALAAAGFKVERLDRPPPAKPELRDD